MLVAAEIVPVACSSWNHGSGFEVMLSDKRRRMRIRAEFSYTYSSLLECLEGVEWCGIVDAERTGVLWFWCALILVCSDSGVL